MKKDELISRQEAIDAIMGQPPEPHYPSWYAGVIDEMPAAEWPKTGKWETVKASNGVSIDFRCSACHRFRFHNGELRKYKFCPNCGAKMNSKEVHNG